MTRTPQQIAADDQLTRAVEGVIAAYVGAPSGLVGDFIVVAALARLDSDGEIQNSTLTHPRDGSMAEYRALGLVSAAAAGFDGDWE